ncbi:TetR family transcriptional regulator [Kutzneria viridogrisea]|uniref:TetR family transcription regulator n=1 Tax=Kutzneria albida DSM 43870 TaxID=1449976 RepID=W5VYA0_9PSEU|nr:TetR family transcription regulator [Kutzneria albida DSM 43870]
MSAKDLLAGSNVKSDDLRTGSAIVTEVTPLRRKPVQQRSAQRVERMLEACAALIEEVGYDGVTTTLIAERAGVAVGSLYQFFPDKRAVVQALTLRNLERFMAVVVQRFESTELDHWWDAVDSMFDVYVEMHRTVPAFSRLHFGDVVDTRLLDEGKDNNTVIAEGLAAIIAQRFDRSMDELALPVAVAIEAADGVLKFAFRRNDSGDQKVVDEAKSMIKGYLSTRLGDPE